MKCHAGALVKKRPARPGQDMPHPCGGTHTRPDMEREEAGLDLEMRLSQGLGIRGILDFPWWRSARWREGSTGSAELSAIRLSAFYLTYIRNCSEDMLNK